MKRLRSPNLEVSQWSDNASFDLVVIGSGAAGLSAALTGVLRGGKVLLVESTGYVGGTTALSAATTWVPGTPMGLALQPDTPEQVLTFLDHAVGERSPRRLREAFVHHSPEAIAELMKHPAVDFQVRALHPDYLSDLPGAVLRGRAIEPKPFDGRLLGPALGLIRPPIPEFTVLGGMMVDRDDIFHLMRLTQKLSSFWHSVRLISRHVRDRLFWPRSTRLVMGNALIARLLYAYLDRGGHLVTLTTPTELKTHLTSDPNPGKQVTGVVLTQTRDGTTQTRQVRAGAVVLASGGFNRDPERRALWLKGADMAWCPGAPGHTGVPALLAQNIGAALGKTGQSPAFWAPVSLRKRADGSQAVFPHFVMDRGKPGMMSVTQSGRRFVNESTSYHLFALAMREAALTNAVPCFLIGDAPALQRYGMGMVRPGAKSGSSALAPYLEDGYLIKGNSLAELAQRLGIAADALIASVERFNAMADAGEDTDFQRGTTEYQRANGDAAWPGKNPCLGALRQGPFYAVRLFPGDIGAALGLQTNADSQVLDGQNQVITGLYACGNDMHSIMGGVYPAPGITLGPGVTFGYLAARHAIGPHTS